MSIETLDRVGSVDGLSHLHQILVERGKQNPDYSLASHPAGRDELVALILLSELLALIDDPDLQIAVDGLWARVTNGRADLDYDLEQIRARFSSDSTSVAKLADVDLVRLIGLCHRGQAVSLKYRSPWRHEEDKEYQGVFHRFHFSDGILYAMFEEFCGRQLVLNVSFMKEIRELDPLIVAPSDQAVASGSNHHWLEGFGVWPGAKPETIEIVVKAPASRYYAAQTWHPDQEDEWDGDTLVRRFPGIPSPELNRRILSLGRFVLSVKPESILTELKLDVEVLSGLCA